jgi:hypothetical protein
VVPAQNQIINNMEVDVGGITSWAHSYIVSEVHKKKPGRRVNDFSRLVGLDNERPRLSVGCDRACR